MARISGLGNKIDDVIKGLGKAVKQSDEVIVSATKNKGDDLASAIKNGVNKVKSNRGMSNNFVSEQAQENVRRNVQNISSAQANQKTTRNVVIGFDMDKATRASKEVASTKIPKTNNTAEIREIADRMSHQKTTASTVTGHNAKARQTEIDTIFNNVMDSRGARDIPEGRSRKLKSKIDQAVDNIQNTPEVPGMPNSGSQASSIIENTPINNTSTGPKTTVNTPEPPPLENNFDLSNFSDDEIEAAKRKAAEAFKEDKLREAAEKDFKSFGDKYFGGITDTYKGTKAGDGFWNSLESAHKNADGSLRWDRIAGTYAAAAVGSRVLSGGGLYKDKYGNTNLPGVPFI